MAIKVRIQNDIITARRWSYSKEKKRSVATLVYSVKKYSAPLEIPKEAVIEHNLTEEDQAIYTDFVQGVRDELEMILQRHSLRSLKRSLLEAEKALIDVELRKNLTLDDYEELSEIINKVKKQVTANKNALRAKERKKAKRQVEAS